MALGSMLFLAPFLELQVLTLVHKLDKHNESHDVEEEDVEKAFLVVEVLIETQDFFSWNESAIVEVSCTEEGFKFSVLGFFFFFGVWLLSRLSVSHSVLQL